MGTRDALLASQSWRIHIHAGFNQHNKPPSSDIPVKITHLIPEAYRDLSESLLFNRQPMPVALDVIQKSATNVICNTHLRPAEP
jgi:hypothetical protein